MFRYCQRSSFTLHNSRTSFSHRRGVGLAISYHRQPIQVGYLLKSEDRFHSSTGAIRENPFDAADVPLTPLFSYCCTTNSHIIAWSMIGSEQGFASLFFDQAGYVSSSPRAIFVSAQTSRDALSKKLTEGLILHRLQINGFKERKCQIDVRAHIGKDVKSFKIVFGVYLNRQLININVYHFTNQSFCSILSS